MNTVNKSSVKSAAKSTVKAVFCVPHLILQTSADLLNSTEALAINTIDGTPMEQSMMERALYTNEKQMAAVAQAKKLKDMVDKKRDQVRNAKINMLKKQLDKAEGVEQQPEVIEPATLPAVAPIEAFVAPIIPSPEIIAPAPPVMEAPKPPVAKTTIPKAKKAEVVIPLAHEAKSK
jgi:hypothetical protein